MRRYTLAPLTAMHYAPPQLVDLAAHAGVWGCGVRLLPTVPGALHYPLMHEPAMLRETLARMQAQGITVFDLEIVRIGEAFRAGDHTAFCEVGQRLGARIINVACDDTDLSRFKRSRSVLSSVAVWQRSERSFSSAFDRSRPSSAGSAGLSCVTGGGSRFRIASKITAEVSPWNGSTPAAIW